MYRVLIIGCGDIAGGFDARRSAASPPLTHAGAFARDPRFQISACVDPAPDRRAAFRKRWNVPASASDLGTLLAKAGDYDVISICSPTPLHEEHFTAALALKPQLIFCEKPVSSTAATTENLISAARRANVKLAVNYTRRWDPAVLRLAAELRSGEWGEVRSVGAVYTKGVVHNGGHLIDLLHLLLGELQVVTAGPPRFDFWREDPSVPALLRSRGGVPVQIMIGDARDYSIFEVTLITEKGVIVMLDGGRSWAIRRVEDSNVFSGYRVLSAADTIEGGFDLAMSRAVANIAGALVDQEALASSGTNALAAQRLCEMIRSRALSSCSHSSEGLP
ncbi:gfo/Idh/MocA family oxidoreductase [Sphingomonas sp. MAH-20]|uniref:Gfo/Idh/MocA family oxidoreductase n=1 Tax=Sphingomonas horti TaxID=2682842 RepID=A0A6I4J0T4_9SPHN|nr:MULTISPECIES: Gfo/Idh/MocA family oxidoreductase [Sphingomonas]MBA2919756.1 Gfo/Idh/MocA family oxidoreductase [Sphingomonas sp. CGMCC 1.13658]MVO77997.1 gfo/Idh/MocA family oxidoreductase [Sphingomonas horti]